MQTKFARSIADFSQALRMRWHWLDGFEHRVREKYDVYLSDDLTAELFAREGIDLPGAIKSIREGGIGNERIR